MTELLHAAAIVPATVGACCTIGARRSRRALAAASAALMALAMVDMAFGFALIPALAWSAILLALALGSAIALRFTGARRDSHAPSMALHGAIGLMVMAALIVPMSAGGGITAAQSGGHSHGGDLLMPLVLAAVTGYSAYTAWVVARVLRQNPGTSALPVTEALCMGLSAVVMAVALLA